MITTVQCSIPSQLNNKPRAVVTDFRLHHTCSIIIVWLHSLSGVIRSLLCNPPAFRHKRIQNKINFKRFKVTNLQWATLMAPVRHFNTINKTYRDATLAWSIRQSGKLVRELCSTFTMYAEKMIYILESGINNGYSYAPYVNLLIMWGSIVFDRHKTC